MYDVIKIGWCSIVVAVFSAIGMIVSYIFACWFTDVERNNKWFEEGYTGDDDVEIAEISSTSDVLKPPPIIVNEDEYDISKGF